jgi:HSP20 family protein
MGAGGWGRFSGRLTGWIAIREDRAMGFFERWLPFRFRRKSAEEKRDESKEASLAARSSSRPESLWPMAPMGSWMREMFDDPFFSEPLGGFDKMDRWFGDFAPSRFTPRVDVTDEDDALKITAELPGMSKDDLDLTLENGLVTIRGEKRHEDESREHGVYRSERYYGSFTRAVPLPEDVDQEKADAAFDKGVLTIHFPKRAAAETSGKRIAIKD